MVSQVVKNPLSYVPFQIFVGDDAGWFSMGTGFFYQLDKDLFIVTNWHVVSGRSWPSGKVNAPGGRRPTKAGVKLASESSASTEKAVYFATRDMSIHSDDTPRWLEHPELRWRCDLVAFPVGVTPEIVRRVHKPANLIYRANIPVVPGGTVFIVGYPRSISSGPGFPIYKSGYVASEPDFDVRVNGEPSTVGGMKDGLIVPAIFIDSLTRQGMSGSPVFAYYSGMWNPDDPYGKFELKHSTVQGEGVQFIGCYGGRATGDRESDAALGLCWRESVIREICEARKPGAIWELSDRQSLGRVTS